MKNGDQARQLVLLFALWGIGCGDGTGVCPDGQTVHPTSQLCETWCGDGVVGAGEECDEGQANANEANVCRVACRLPKCGDEILDNGEECDDGPANGNGPDACRVACLLPFCGDGIVDSDEECDDGGANGPTSNACRGSCVLPFCGDGILDDGEGCDDGNSVAKDGCSPSCAKETSVTYSYTGGPQKYVVPAGVTKLRLTVYGASGYGANTNWSSNPIDVWGMGGGVSGVLAVEPGETVWLYVGQEGLLDGAAYNGGGGPASSWSGTCAGGGGASDVRVGGQSLNHRVLVAGGGGGTVTGVSAGLMSSVGGSAGGLVGEDAKDRQCQDFSCLVKGFGGTQTASALWSQGGIGFGGPCEQGGVAAQVGGAGGGGWYGGGGAGGANNGGGGGSSYIGGVDQGEFLQLEVYGSSYAYRKGNGQIMVLAIP